MSQAHQNIEPHVIYIPIERVVDYKMRITLKPCALQKLIEIAGPTPDERFLSNPEEISLIKDQEEWAWWVHYDPDPNIMPQHRYAGFWFKNLSMATYFKLLWGGEV